MSKVKAIKKEELKDFQNIGEALGWIYSEIGYVQKTGKLAFGSTRYTFAGEADLIKAIRPKMVAAGVIMYPTTVNYTREGNLTRSTYEYVFLHVDTNTSIVVAAAGEGADSQDKAAGKAATNAFKYALRQTFMIETGDDPDDTASDYLDETLTPKELPMITDVSEESHSKWIDELLAEAGDCQSKAGLTALWKVNLAAINAMKGGYPALYEDLVINFKTFKERF